MRQLDNPTPLHAIDAQYELRCAGRGVHRSGRNKIPPSDLGYRYQGALARRIEYEFDLDMRRVCALTCEW